MIPVSVRRRIQALLRNGHSKASVARTMGVSLRSVKRIAKEPAMDQTNDAAERQRRGIGRPSIVRGFMELVVDLLRENPEMKSAEILRRILARGYGNGKGAMYALIASLRSVPAKGSTHSVTAPTGRAVTEDRKRPGKAEGLGAG